MTCVLLVLIYSTCVEPEVQVVFKRNGSLFTFDVKQRFPWSSFTFRMFSSLVHKIAFENISATFSAYLCLLKPHQRRWRWTWNDFTCVRNSVSAAAGSAGSTSKTMDLDREHRKEERDREPLSKYDSVHESNPLSALMDAHTLSSDSDNDDDTIDSSKQSISSYALLKLKNEDNKQLWKEMIKNGTTKVLFPKPKIIRSRNLTDATAVFQCNAWDDVEWDDEMKQRAIKVVSGHLKETMADEKKEKLEAEAHKFWDDFYGIHKNRFFRDRNWLFSEFPELESPYGGSVDPEEARLKVQEMRKDEKYPGQNSKFKVLEVGCGAGNTIFPLLSSNNNPHTYVYCCDFSPQAIDLIKNESTFEPLRCTPFVLDITEENPVTPFAEGSIDVITAIFVVSAISPSKFEQVVRNFSRFLKPGGLVLFRDYGRFDLAQLRFKDGRCIEENFYARGDGTRVYFFTEAEVEALFINGGFEKHTLLVDRRLQVNRGKQLKMYRVWVQGKFIKSPEKL